MRRSRSRLMPSKPSTRAMVVRIGFSSALLLSVLSPLEAKTPERPLAEGSGISEPTPNPWLSFLTPEVRTDWAYWSERARQEGRERQNLQDSRAEQGASAASTFDEIEPNDSPETANRIETFGTIPGSDPAVDILNSTPGPPAPALLHPEEVGATFESSGSALNRPLDLDYFSFDLRAGDILGVTVNGAGARLSLFDSEVRLRVASGQDASFVYPPSSPLPGGGNAVLAYVIDTTGRYFLRVETDHPGPYTASMRVFRNPFWTGQESPHQVLFLDFDGESIDAAAVFGTGNSPAVLSPLADFLPAWGLDGSAEDAVIDSIVSVVEENLSRDLRERGLNGDFAALGLPGEFDVVVTNSRDHPDLFGQPNISRVIVGGTNAQLGIEGLIGRAQSIDPGNFAVGETGVVLLNRLSAPAGDSASVNSIPLASGGSVIDLIGSAVGNIISHEAGHYLGNFHTDPQTQPSNLMTIGGGLERILGLGNDGVFGTGDDSDVDFRTSAYAANEGFSGTEDTLNTIAFGCSTPSSETVVIAGCDSGAPNLYLSGGTRVTEEIGICARSEDTDGFLVCVIDLTQRLVDEGQISQTEQAEILRCAALASIP